MLREAESDFGPFLRLEVQRPTATQQCDFFGFLIKNRSTLFQLLQPQDLGGLDTALKKQINSWALKEPF